MAKPTGAHGAKTLSIKAVEDCALRVADELHMELVEAVLQKESRGKCLCLYIDKEGGVSLDDCERFHKQVQPLLEDVDYDFLEVSSPGIDRPVKTQRDFERNRGAQVEVRLFAPMDGSKQFYGALAAMDADTVTIDGADGSKTFDLKRVAIVKPVIELDESDFENLDESGEQP